MMSDLSRRDFLAGLGSVAVGVAAAGCQSSPELGPTSQAASPIDPTPTSQVSSQQSTESLEGEEAFWQDVRSQFELDPDKIHLSAMYISSHPKVVREAIENHRKNLDRDPVGYLDSINRKALAEVRSAASDYLGVSSEELALTESTTMGVGLVYNGMIFEKGDEIIACADDYYVTVESLRLAEARSGAVQKSVALYDNPSNLSAQAVLDKLMPLVSSKTRVMALTWVHSGTGVKLPLRKIADALKEVNESRSSEERVLLCVDGVHGFGIEKELLSELGADFFMAGCHKWLFGPRGTGLVWAPRSNWPRVKPSIPSFTGDAEWTAWLTGSGRPGPTTAEAMSPGGFKAFEHHWALAEAFQFRSRLGREKVAERTHQLCRQLKEGLKKMNGYTLVTPLDPELSSGIVCFESARHDPMGLVRALAERGIVATVTPYAKVYARVSPSLLNTPDEIERTLAALRELA